MPLYFFGCGNRDAGHYWWDKDQRQLPYRKMRTDNPWGDEIDGGLAPSGQQIEGQATYTVKDGWCAIAFWDRSVDTRRGSNVVFAANWIFPKESLLEEAKRQFPWFFSRITYEVKFID